MIISCLGLHFDQLLRSRNIFLKNGSSCSHIGKSPIGDLKISRTDRDRVKKLTFGNCRISLKTMMDGSKYGDRRSRSNFLIEWRSKCIQKSGIENSVDQNAVKK
jgi:hypothetical protein